MTLVLKTTSIHTPKYSGPLFALRIPF